MANQLLNLDVDWASKIGAADSTVAFNETFDVKINGVGELVGTLRFVLLSQNISDEDAILWTFFPSDYEKTEDGGAIIRNVCINTRDALDMLKQQGGKSKLFLSLLADNNGIITDYGISKISLTLGSFLEDPDLPPNTEIGGMSIGELKAYVEAKLEVVELNANAAEDAKNEAKGYADEAKGVKGIAQQASVDAGEAKQKAEVAEQVAKGAQYAKVFATEVEMKTWAAAEMAKAEAEREAKVGDNLYIEELNVPDYWWTGEGNGYAQLETGAVKVTVDTTLNANSNNPIANKTVKSALDQKADKTHYHDSYLQAGDGPWSDDFGAGFREGPYQTIANSSLGGIVGLTEIGGEGYIAWKPSDYPAEQIRKHRLGGGGTTVMQSKASANIGSVTNMANLSDETLSYQIGTLKDWGFAGKTVKPKTITLFRRQGDVPNKAAALNLRIWRWNGSSWTIAYASSNSTRFNDFTINGQPMEYTMVHQGLSEFIPTDERVIIAYADYAKGEQFVEFGAKRVSAPKNMNVVNQTVLPSNGGAGIQGWGPYMLAAYFEYEADAETLIAGENITIQNGVISAAGGSSGDVSIPVGGCIKFGEAKLKHYNSGGDIRFDLAGGTFCVEGGWLILGNGAQFRAGDFCVPGYELGEILNNAKNGGGGSEGTPYLAVGDGCSVPAVAGTMGIALGRGAGYKNSNAATLTGTIAVGELATPFCNYSIVIGNNSCSSEDYQILIGYAIDGDSNLRRYVDDTSCSSYAIMFQACSTGVFFASDACNNYATMIGYKNSGGCYEERRIEDAFAGGGGSYIKSSEAGSPYDIPGCSSGIAIGADACIGMEVRDGVAIGNYVMATRDTPIKIGSGCAAITVNSNYELCVGGYPVGGGGSSNDSICVYDSVGYCAAGFGANYVAIGDNSYAYSDSVAVGASTYANSGEVAIGIGAGNGARVNGFIAENLLYNVRRFRACNASDGNELFFATKEGSAVIGGEFDRNLDGNAALCYFYLKDVASRKETVFGNFAEDYGSNGVVIGEEAATHSNSRSDVSIGYKAGLDPLFLSIVDGNSLSNIRAFAAGYDSMGNRGDTAFFASCNGEVVIGGLTSYGGNAYGYRFVSLSDIIGAVESAGAVDMRYAIVQAPFATGVLTLVDRAVNTAGTYEGEIAIVMPTKVAGKVRDFMLDITASGELAMNFDGVTLLPRDGDDTNLVPEIGRNIFMFTEIGEDVFLVSRTKVVEAEVEA